MTSHKLTYVHIIDETIPISGRYARTELFIYMPTCTNICDYWNYDVVREKYQPRYLFVQECLINIAVLSNSNLSIR